MKTRQALRVANSLQNGNLKPLHVIRAASLQLRRPLIVRIDDADLIYHPAELSGNFYQYYSRDYDHTYIVHESERRKYENARLPGGSLLKSVPGRLVYSAHAGANISQASKQALQVAFDFRSRVVLPFNDVTVVLRPFSDPDFGLQEYRRISDEQHEAYLKSDEYRKYQQRQAAELAKAQAVVDAAVAELPTVLESGLDAVIPWCRNISDSTDHSGVNVPTAEIVSQFESAGYEVDAYVNDPLVKNDRRIMGLWLVGQALGCLQSMGAMHPTLTHKFANQYENWQDAA